MRSKKRRKVNIMKLIGCLLVLFCIIFFAYKLISKLNKEEELVMIQLVGEDVEVAKGKIDKFNIVIDISYQYSDTVEKDRVISQSIKSGVKLLDGDKLELVVSLGKLDKEKMKSDGINELGKVPIMMYHGIKNIKNSDTANTGGNVDKDGYTRTVEAFRNDLEMYYQKGYRMVKLSDYVNGRIDTQYGYSPIVLTFDDGNDNNILVKGLDNDGNIIIDENSAVGVLESFKKKYPDYNVTAIFFVNDGLFNQPEYNEKILNWLVDNGYEVGNHTKHHDNLSNTTEGETEEVIGYMYNKLESILGDKYQKILALPFGSPYLKSHNNYKYVVSGEYNGKKYETLAALRVGWEPEVSPFNKDFDRTFLKRCRAYDNNGVEFDIEMVFSMLESSRYISDGRVDTIVTSSSNRDIVNSDTELEVIYYE